MTYSVIQTFNELVNECVEAKKREHNGDVETCQIAKSYINGAYDAVLAVSGKEQADIFIAKVDKRFDKYLDDQWALKGKVMDLTAIFVLVLIVSLFFGFNAVLAFYADRLPEWMIPKGYYDDDA